MTREIRWRILTLQIVGTLVLAFVAGVAYWGHNFTHDQVRSQLVAQKIAMPDKATLSPKEYSQADISALAPFSGTMLDSGPKAQAYADHYIAVHLAAMGATYSQISAKYIQLTQVQKLPPTNPQVQQVAGLRNTIFMGTMLRSTLLSAYAFWFVGDLALYAAIGLTFGAVLVFLAFLYELLVEPKREGIVDIKERRPSARVAVS